MISSFATDTIFYLTPEFLMCQNEIITSELSVRTFSRFPKSWEIGFYRKHFGFSLDLSSARRWCGRIWPLNLELSNFGEVATEWKSDSFFISVNICWLIVNFFKDFCNVDTNWLTRQQEANESIFIAIIFLVIKMLCANKEETNFTIEGSMNTNPELTRLV